MTGDDQQSDDNVEEKKVAAKMKLSEGGHVDAGMDGNSISASASAAASHTATAPTQSTTTASQIHISTKPVPTSKKSPSK